MVKQDDAFRIGSIELFIVELKLFREFKVAFGDLPTEHLLVRLETSEGIVGWGETGHLLPRYSGETSRSALMAAEYLAESLVDKPSVNLARWLRTLSSELVDRPQVTTAFDLALHDVWARKIGVPICELFGGGTVREIRPQLDIGVGSVDQVTADVQRSVDMGIETVGLKVAGRGGAGVADDILMVREIRDRFPTLRIWVDANGGYDLASAWRARTAFGDLGVELFEQPLPGDDFAGMADLCKAFPPPLIVADESARSIKDIVQIWKLRAAHMIHQKLPKLGGLRATHEAVALCRGLGMPISVASLAMADYGQAALMHLTVSHEELLAFPPKLRGGGLFFPEDYVEERLKIVDGHLLLPMGPGTGLRMNEEKLRSEALESLRVQASARA